MNTLHASAPGKLVLLGEYAVVFGAKALVMAVDRRVRIKITPLDQEPSLLSASELHLHEEPLGRDPRTGFVEMALKHGRDSGPVHIEVDSSELFDEGRKIGLGSSAALTTAVVAARSQELELQSLFELSLRAHREAQGGVGSGIDVAASTYGGCLQYVPGAVEAQLSWPPGLRWVAVRAPQSANTANLVGRVRRAVDEFKEASDTIQLLAQITAEGIDAMSCGDVEQFLDVVRRFDVSYEELGRLAGAPLIDDFHRSVRRAVLDAGGAYKASGAGAGDVGLAFFSEGEDMERRLQRQGFETLSLELESRGVDVSVG